MGLKQVVDCRLPKKASYQAIVLQSIKVRGLHFSMQSSTKLEVKIHRYESIPMVSKMGLQISRSRPGEYTTVDIIEADFAVWAQLDLEEQDGINLTVRAGAYEFPASTNGLAFNAETLRTPGNAIVRTLRFILGQPLASQQQQVVEKKQTAKKKKPGKKQPPQARQPLAVSQGKTTS